MNTYATVDEYISSYPESTQKILQDIRNTIQETVPEAEEKISYGIPTFFLNGNLIHYAAYENHIGLYPGAAPVEAFKDKLTSYETSKGTIRFPIDEPMPFDLIKEITRACVERNLNK